MNALTVGSLFSGIGGLDLGLERAGMRVIWQSEIDPYASRVLKKHWPEVTNHGDIKKIDWANVEPPDVICGGYPCQPFSLAGKRNGEDDPRHLWPWVRESLRVLRPRYAILENVRGHLSLGGTTVIRELASIGYNAEWRLISAASVGAVHRRERLIIVAYPNGGELDGEHVNGTDTTAFTEVPPVFSISRRSSNKGPFSHWLLEPGVGRVANGIPARVDRLRGLGNAVVPQVAEIVGRLVVEHSTR
jgi:DNA (cytosine-5)-methyltransferase 1